MAVLPCQSVLNRQVSPHRGQTRYVRGYVGMEGLLETWMRESWLGP